MQTQPTSPLDPPRRKPFTVSERGPRRPLVGVAWTVLAILMAAMILVSMRFMAGWPAALFTLLFVLLLFVTAVKAFGGFTGVQRFGPRKQPTP